MESKERFAVDDEVIVVLAEGSIRGTVQAWNATVVTVLDASDGSIVKVDASLPIEVLRAKREPAPAVPAAARKREPELLVNLYGFDGALVSSHAAKSRRAAVRLVAETPAVRRAEIVDERGRVEHVDGSAAIGEAQGYRRNQVTRDVRHTYNATKVRAPGAWYGAAA